MLKICAKDFIATPKWGFPPICDQQDFFQKSGSVTFVPLWFPNFILKISRSLRYKDGPQTNRGTDGPQTNGLTEGPKTNVIT